MADIDRAAEQWREGEQRLDALDDPRRRGRAQDLVGIVIADLRRRLGGPFSIDELAEVYEQGTDWAVALVTTYAPDEPWLWDPRLIADPAFARYARGARDFAGGRRL